MMNEQLDRGSIYLSGGMEHSDDGGAGWRKHCSRQLRTMGYYPIDLFQLDELYSQQHGKVFAYPGEDYESQLYRKANIRKHFIEADTKLIINDSDALVVYYDQSVRRGAGTIAECQVAFMHDIPVLIVCDWQEWQDALPGWLHAISSKVFTSFDALYLYLERLPYGVLKEDIYGNHRSEDYYLCSLSGEPFHKSKTHFVSKVSPLYSSESVEIVKQVHEQKYDRYAFFKQVINNGQIGE